jgi:hypothetical protein
MQRAWRPIVVVILAVLVIIIGRTLTRDSHLEPGDPVRMEIRFLRTGEEPVDTGNIRANVSLFEEGDTSGVPYDMPEPAARDTESVTLALEYAPGRAYLVMPESKSYIFRPDRFRINLRGSISRKESHTSFTCEAIPQVPPAAIQTPDSLAREAEAEIVKEPVEAPDAEPVVAKEPVETPDETIATAASADFPESESRPDESVANLVPPDGSPEPALEQSSEDPSLPDLIAPKDSEDPSERDPSPSEHEQTIPEETRPEDPDEPAELVREQLRDTIDHSEEREQPQPAELLEPKAAEVKEPEEPTESSVPTETQPIEIEPESEELTEPDVPTKTQPIEIEPEPEEPIEIEPEPEEQEPVTQSPEIPKAEVESPERAAIPDVAKSFAVYDERTGEVEELFSRGEYTEILAIQNDPPGRDHPDYLQAQALYLKIQEYKGCALMSLRKPEAAVEVFQEILTQTKRAGLAQFNLLICLYQLGRYKEVIDQAYPQLKAMWSTIPRGRLKETSMKAEFFRAMSYFHLCEKAAFEPRAPDCRRATLQLDEFLTRWLQEDVATTSKVYFEAARHHRDQIPASGR